MHLKNIIVLCINGDRSAQFELYNRYVDLILMVCSRYSNNISDAKDNAQNVFIKIFGKLSSFNSQKGSFESWVHRIAINECLQQIRKDKNGIVEIDLANIYLSTTEELTFEKGDYLVHLKKTIDRLPDGYRMILLLYAVDGLDHFEISELLGISINTSRSQLFKARKRLVQLLRPVDQHQNKF